MGCGIVDDEGDDDIMDCSCGGGNEGIIDEEFVIEFVEFVGNCFKLVVMGIVSLIDDEVDEGVVLVVVGLVLRCLTNVVDFLDGDVFVLSFIELATE